MLTADQLITILGLVPLQGEGGYFAETYRSAGQIPATALPAQYPGGGRLFSTAIYYLLSDDPDSFSALHRLRGDEIYHFYLGDPVEMLLLNPDGAHSKVVLGQDLEQGMRLQFNVPAGCWQGSRLLPGGRFALMGTTMAPGFDLRDFEAGQRESLTRAYPGLRAEIHLLTRPE